MRLDKYLAHAGVGSRQGVKKLIKNNLVFVNGELATSPEQSVNPNVDQVHVDDQEVHYEEYVYLMMHKPSGLISATEDAREKTIMTLVKGYEHRDLHIVGRLDKYTTGLILLTDDGTLTHRLTSPKHHVEKHYAVTVDKPLDPSLVNKFANGLTLEDGYKTLPATLTIESATQANLVVTEGKFHQVRRMFEKLGYEVINLHRFQIGLLNLGKLALGEVRPLTKDELTKLISLHKD
jgi:16S rRNA pseudouridine516 synthase